MSRTLWYQARAIADLAAIRQWQEQPGSGEGAVRRLRAIRTAIDRLKQFPCLYPVGDHEGVREFSCQGHRVIYIVDPDTGRNDDAGNVTILRVFGPGQFRDLL